MALQYKSAGNEWREKRIAADLSVAEAAIRSGLSAATILNIEHGSQPGSAKSHRTLARVYGWKGGAALGAPQQGPAEPSEPYQVTPPAATSVRQCLVYGVANCLSSAHGIGDLEPESAAALEAVPTPPTLARRRRIAAFRAVDTSMEGPDPATSIRPGDLLYIDPDAELYDGAIALVKVEDEILCKLWCREGESVRLASYSPGVPPRTVEGRRVAWAYRVVFVQPAGRPV
jgi:phage repressor protein C with HTH and peptisase S24 domain